MGNKKRFFHTAGTLLNKCIFYTWFFNEDSKWILILLPDRFCLSFLMQKNLDGLSTWDCAWPTVFNTTCPISHFKNMGKNENFHYYWKPSLTDNLMSESKRKRHYLWSRWSWIETHQVKEPSAPHKTQTVNKRETEALPVAWAKLILRCCWAVRQTGDGLYSINYSLERIQVPGENWAGGRRRLKI